MLCLVQELPLKWKWHNKLTANMGDFGKAVLAVVAGIARGQVLTYKEVAEKAGYPKAFRAVGGVLNKNYNPQIPCHRVVRSDGKAGGYNRGEERKKQILNDEGINF